MHEVHRIAHRSVLARRWMHGMLQSTPEGWVLRGAMHQRHQIAHVASLQWRFVHAMHHAPHERLFLRDPMHAVHHHATATHGHLHG